MALLRAEINLKMYREKLSDWCYCSILGAIQKIQFLT